MKQKSMHVENDDFDPRLEDYISDEEKVVEKPLPLEIRMKFSRPTPDREFIMVQLDNNPTRSMKIGANLPPAVEKAS
ncbi:hypothetical protein A2U01_0036627 [Trifolium medium]|uniref:Uncharacterized protein n=1 Tax=Trifolium medium TaxID=97028 RepID=A0A392PVG5_9FABA|nr:hypothetical protein [Trifolium medium]